MKFKAQSLVLILLSFITLSAASFSHAATEEMRSLGGFNTVLIYTPTTMSPLGARSLMIVLHGCTQTSNDYRTANLQDAADKNGVVIAVPEAMYKAGYGCWDYWSATPNRNLKDYKNLISLAKAMTDDPQYEIDSKQVYMVGLSSGGVFAMNTACLAPDVFAGMGLVGSASAGTPASAPIVTIDGTKKMTQQKCEAFAGTCKPHFQTQVMVSAYGTHDFTVDQKYGPQNAAAMALVYGHSDVSINADMPKAKIKVNPENTVSLVELTNEGHTWPGGPGASGAYIGDASINLGIYLGEFFNANNRRVRATVLPPECEDDEPIIPPVTEGSGSGGAIPPIFLLFVALLAAKRRK